MSLLQMRKWGSKVQPLAEVRTDSQGWRWMDSNSIRLPHLFFPPPLKPGLQMHAVAVATATAKSCLTFSTPWTVARQTALSMGFPRQEYWSEQSFPPLGNVPGPEIKPASAALAGSPPGKPAQALVGLKAT